MTASQSRPGPQFLYLQRQGHRPRDRGGWGAWHRWDTGNPRWCPQGLCPPHSPPGRDESARLARKAGRGPDLLPSLSQPCPRAPSLAGPPLAARRPHPGGPGSRVIWGPVGVGDSAWRGPSAARGEAHLLQELGASPCGTGRREVRPDRPLGPLPALRVPSLAPTQKAWGSPCRATR